MNNVRIRSYSGPQFPTFGLIQSISLHSVQMRENTDQNNSEYIHFLRIVILMIFLSFSLFFLKTFNSCFVDLGQNLSMSEINLIYYLKLCPVRQLIIQPGFPLNQKHLL